MLASLLGTPASAAFVSVISDGADGTSARIAIRSAITNGDLASFRKAIDSVGRTATGRIGGVPFITVELNSPGGDVVEALGIGRLIYQHSAMTLVRPGQECVSACVFIMAAGAVRSSTGAAIGVHRPLLVSWRNMDYRTARAKYDGLMRYIRDYFLYLGVSEAAYDIMMRTDSGSMHYFRWDELEAVRLRGESPEWRSHFVTKPTVTAQSAAPDRSFAEAPTLPEIDESYRYVVFMPGDFPPERAYEGLQIATQHREWESLGEWQPPWDWTAPDIVGFLRAAYDAIWPRVAPNLWLLGLLAFELVRGRHISWPDSPLARRNNRDQWRLAPFEPGGFQPNSQSSFSTGS